MVTHWSDRNRIVPAVYILLWQNGKVLLLRRGSDVSYGSGLYSLPAGHVDRHESVRQAAVRECEEEIGIRIEPADLKLVNIAYYESTESDHERVSFFFRCDHFSGVPINREPEKCDELRWFSSDKLPDDMVVEVRRVFTAIASRSQFSEYGFEE